MIDHLLDRLAPHPCCSCGVTGVVICESCKYNIIDQDNNFCMMCQKPVANTDICKKCIHGADFVDAWVVGERSHELKKLIDEYKFGSKRAAARHLAEILDAKLPVLPEGIVVVGVPSSRRSVRVRGFDHMRLIVGSFAKRRRVEPATLLVRTTNKELHSMNLHDRKAMCDKLFVATKVDKVPSKVLLVDDIITTGTTVAAACSILKAMGVQEIYVAVIARQPFVS